MSISITSQPATNSLNAAYRPIMVSVSINPAGPVMYCDVYFNNVFYKTFSKTQGLDFDIQDAAKEYLRKFLPPLGTGQFYNAANSITSCYVKIRSSTVDINGFTIADTPVPVQATGTTSATGGGGVQSNTFYILNTTLQQEDNQVLPTHLTAFRTGTWEASAFPLTHRIDGYEVGKQTSDYFPIVSEIVPSRIRLHYHVRSTGQWLDTSGGSPSCVPIYISGSLPDGTQNTAYSQTIALSGTAPFTIASGAFLPFWLTATVSGSNLVFTGTPTTTGPQTVNIHVTNACGTVQFISSFNIASAVVCVPVAISGTVTMPDGRTTAAYSYAIALTGTAPFSISSPNLPAGLSAAVSGSTVNITGTPTTAATGATVAFTVTNACGSVNVSDTINITTPVTINVAGSVAHSARAVQINLDSALPEDIELFIDTTIDNNGSFSPERFTVGITAGATSGSDTSTGIGTIQCIEATSGSSYSVSLNSTSGNTYNITLTIIGTVC